MFIYLFNHICICRYMYIEYVTLNIIYICVTLISWWLYRHYIYLYMFFLIFYVHLFMFGYIICWHLRTLRWTKDLVNWLETICERWRGWRWATKNGATMDPQNGSFHSFGKPKLQPLWTTMPFFVQWFTSIAKSGI